MNASDTSINCCSGRHVMDSPIRGDSQSRTMLRFAQSNRLINTAIIRLYYVDW